jgi:hypothetical protein
MACFDQRWRRAIAALTFLTAGLGLAGCGGGGISNPLPAVTGSLPSWFGSAKSASVDASGTPVATPGPSMDEDCPVADVRRGASTLRSATKTEGATANDVRYQITIVELVRECKLIAGTVHIRVGVRGHVIVGPAGAPSQVSIPLRYAVIREGVEPKTIVTDFRHASVSMPPGNGNVQFTDIEEDLSFPMPSQRELESYVVYVGFDEASDHARPAKKKGKRRR